MSHDRYDIAMIGGGIVGLASARELCARRGLSLIVLEAEGRVAAHQTSHNSGVIHAGLYYKPGSLKARNCVAGREWMYAFCREHGIAHERCGKLVVATCEEERPRLEALKQRGEANGLLGIQQLSAEALREYEPHVAGVAGLWVPDTGIVNYRLVAEKFAELVRAAGGHVAPGRRMTAVRPDGADLIVETTGGPVRCRYLIGCAGLQADRVARRCGVDPGIKIVPFRGEYYELVPQRQFLVRNLIYPVPDPQFPFLGVHFTRMIGGGIEAGPNAVLALARHGYRWRDVSPRDLAEMFSDPGLWRLMRRHWKTGAGEVYRSLSKRAFVGALQTLIPELSVDDVVRAGSGVRAQALERSGRLVDDFHIIQAERMIHVLSAPSPAATSSISIGRTVADLAAKQFDLR